MSQITLHRVYRKIRRQIFTIIGFKLSSADYFFIYSVYQQIINSFHSVIALKKFLYIGWRNCGAIL